ncbi:GerMN domain-containing protein [Crassaminicella thermophila]|uniref:GerMN domain-containing protein n=1 Tax=Crassaminicella thermophila TaxID=2599308 RepID=A0A5C0SJJ2_CRATE|nr:GerMN domain-containing protein [Crassaminicella thermophila]QEK13408.1 GerMN domain-containing protein [Crassaminicella thermophila]
MKKSICLLCIILLFVSGCTSINNSKHEIEVTLYYANEAYIETGNEALDKFITVKKKINPTNNHVLSILNELKKDPNIENANTQINKDLIFLDAKIENGIAYVNVSSQNLNGGSLQEFFIIGQIVYSLTSLEDVQKVQFLVDGKKQETLMGHYTIDKPFDENLDQ